MNAKERTREKSGSALLTVMIIVTIVSLTAGSFYIFAASMSQQTRQMTESIRAQTIAEAGAHLAYSELKQDYGWRPELNSYPSPCGAGTFTVFVHGDEHARARVISVGYYKNARSVIGMDLFDANRPPPGVLLPVDPEQANQDVPSQDVPYEQMYWGSLNYALFANVDLRLNGTPQVNGHMHANWDFILNGNDGGFVEGSLVSARSIDNRVGESFHAEWREVPFPQLTDPEFQLYLSEAQAAGQLTQLAGDQVYHRDHTFTGITVVDGDITFRGSGERIINGMLYATGSITANGAAVIRIDGVMMSGGSIRFNGAAGIFTHDYVGTGGPAGDEAIASAIIVGPINAGAAEGVMQFSDGNADVRLAGWWQGTPADIPASGQEG